MIDDEKNMRYYLKTLLEYEGYRVLLASDGIKGLEVLQNEYIDTVLCDICMPNMDGMAFLKSLSSMDIKPTVITMSAYATIDTAVETMKLGAYDYVSKPFKSDEIILVLKKAEERESLRKENIILKKEVQERYGFHNLIGRSPQMKKVFEIIEKVSHYKSSVLITGKSGTGKEMVAKAIHYCSPRRDKVFLAVNCAAIPEPLLESEFFGHKKGSFTNAINNRKGIFEEAGGGTIFLDEVGELPFGLQVKMLRTLQDGEVRRIGDEQPRYVDVRIIAATSKNLEKMVKQGQFREDLFYRLNVVPINIPPLVERKDDIVLLVNYFLSKFSKNLGSELKKITPEALSALEKYNWRGNVRELENAIERAIVFSNSRVIDIDDIRGILSDNTVENTLSLDEDEYSIKKVSKTIERKLIKKALKKTKGNRTQASKLLQISYPALLHKINEYEIEESC